MNVDADKPVKTTKLRRWFRFRLRTLLVMLTVLSVPLGWAGWELDLRRKEKAAIAWIERMGGRVLASSFSRDERSWRTKTKDKWFGKRVRAVMLIGKNVSDLSPPVELKNLETLVLDATQVSDLSPLAELKNLERLRINFTPISDEQVEELKLVRPNCQLTEKRNWEQFLQ